MMHRKKYLTFAAALLITSPAVQADNTGKAVPIFKDGEAQIVPAFKDPEKWIKHDLWVQTGFDTDGDGKLDRMHVDVTRPAQTDTQGLKLPVIYASSPYYAGVSKAGPEHFWDVNHEIGAVPPQHPDAPEVIRTGTRPVISTSEIKKWLPRGYIVVHSSSPGTGLSQGSPTIGGRNETLAPKAVIDWLCGRVKGYTSAYGTQEVKAFWAKCSVGMTGTSYNGTLPLAAATTGVKGLNAIIPIAPNTSYYHYYRSNGLVRNPGGYSGEDIDVLYDFVHSGDENKRAHNNRVIRDGVMAKNMDRVTGDYNDFWHSRNYRAQLKNVKAALLMSHGFNDWNVMPAHSYQVYDTLRNQVPAQVYYHQAGHGGPPPLKMMNRWFTRYLHGVENGVENDPRAFIVREHVKKDKPTAYADFPNPAAEDVTFYLSKGAPEAGALSLKKPTSQGKETLTDNYSFSGMTLAQAEITEHRLLYVSPTLTKDLHLSGTSTIKIRMASSKKAANLSVYLISLPWKEGRRAKIYDNLITRGWADPQNHNAKDISMPKGGKKLKKGKFVEFSFELQPDDQVVQKGQQIGLMIISSDKGFTLQPAPGTKLTVDLDKTNITIPVVGGKKAFIEATTTTKMAQKNNL
jgi:X-Pro dipeptidyl-peptidase